LGGSGRRKAEDRGTQIGWVGRHNVVAMTHVGLPWMPWAKCGLQLMHGGVVGCGLRPGTVCWAAYLAPRRVRPRPAPRGCGAATGAGAGGGSQNLRVACALPVPRRHFVGRWPCLPRACSCLVGCRGQLGDASGLMQSQRGIVAMTQRRQKRGPTGPPGSRVHEGGRCMGARGPHGSVPGSVVLPTRSPSGDWMPTARCVVRDQLGSGTFGSYAKTLKHSSWVRFPDWMHAAHNQ